MKSDTLYLKTIIKELDFLRKQSLFNETSEENFLLFTNKLIEKMLDPRNAKENYNHLSERKHKIRKTIKNNYLSTKKT